MKGIALTQQGTEDISALEIKELINCKSEKKQGYVLFEFAEFKDLFKLCYLMQSTSRLLYVLGSVTMLDKINFTEWIGEKTFAVKSQDKALAAEIAKKIPGNASLAKPDATFFIIDGDMCIDFSGDISKRHYRIFMGSETLKSTSAYALLRSAGFTRKKILLDPFCRAGTIAIEAALFACTYSQHFFNKEFPFTALEKFKSTNFDKIFEELDAQKNPDSASEINAVDREFRSIQAAKKNAKIAGILKKINFSKNDLEQLDLKFEEKTIDIIATKPPQPSHAMPEKLIDRIYKELFHQASFALKNKGVIALIIRTGIEQLKKWAGENKLICIEERKIMQGQETLTILVFQK